MLTSTYTLVALSIEQASARMGLQSLIERWHPAAWRHAAPTPRQFELACDALRMAFDNCYWRKLDKFVVPALRRAGAAQDLLAELDALTLAAIEARADAHAAAAVHDHGFGEALERCCNLLLERLEREERELFPLARTYVPSEAWFAIANQMMANDAWQVENRSYPASQIPGALSRSSARQSPPLAVPHYATH
ncbi:hypothetical protein [Massilia yuzhufengensis]|uniref:Hemerythrin HHE cation binding domain-containing protein n=1 Tax=Massilia yuzhufengensis TaxID=1164594 RepID=A0A1I1SD11_9BURK|nr:hypothetical protein [Massilia yuzhufengensis]SFD44317.1 hypothetical protein SAMN05216204_12540 [Massilia yuzhufengensis]